MPRNDLIVLVADLDMEQALVGLLARHQSLNISPFSYELYRHPEHDPGCYKKADAFLKSRAEDFRYALVVFDLDGCGAPVGEVREVVEHEVETRVQAVGWENRAAAIVIDPELEAWIWSDSPHVANELGWSGRTPELRDWLVDRGYLDAGDTKPSDPKQATISALKEVHMQRSATVYERLASRVSLSRCIDPAFDKLRTVLRTWFPATAGTP